MEYRAILDEASRTLIIERRTVRGDYARHYIELDRLTDAAEVLRAVYTVAGKSWVTPALLGSTVRALKILLVSTNEWSLAAGFVPDMGRWHGERLARGEGEERQAEEKTAVHDYRI